MKTLKLFLAASILVLLACKKDPQVVSEPLSSDESELITTFILSLSDTTNSANTSTVIFRDLDGPGGNPPSSYDTIRLQNNTVYWASILLLNEAVSPSDTISEEVLAEAKDHLICFTPTGLDLTILRTDTDGMYELGLQSIWTIKAISSGNISIELKHQPGIKNGTCAPGETDIQLNFQTVIE